MSVILDPASFASELFKSLTAAQLVLVIVVVPAVAAGAVSDEKSRGTLAQLLASGLSGPAIILSKLASRLLWTITLLGCTVPVLFLASFLGGIDPQAVLAASLITFCAAIFACALALALSVEARRTHEVLVMTYLILALLWLAPLLPLGGWAWTFLPGSLEEQLVPWNPFLAAFLPYLRMSGPAPWPEQLGFMGRALVLSAIAVFWASARIHKVALGQADRLIHAPTRIVEWRRFVLRPVLEINPVLWREWRRRSHSIAGQFMALTYALLAIAISFWLAMHRSGVLYQWWPAAVYRLGGMSASLLCCALGGGLLLLSILSVMGLAEDRECGGFEILLTTPMSTRSIVWGKWWGACRLVPLVLLAPVSITLAANWQASSFHLLFATSFVAAVSLVYAEAVVAFGIVIAIWVPQTGRAVGISVGILVFSWLAGWTVTEIMPKILGASALTGVPYVIQAFQHHDWVEEVSGVLPWMFVYGGATAVLFYLIDVTIYRCVGRVRPVPPEEILE
jgi:ABC-type transport system involved in multi-copper enzyme maturation permease subunit